MLITKQHLTILLVLLVPCSAFAVENPKSVYHINPPVDWSIIGATSLGSVIPIAFRSHFVTPHCPCDLAEVNGIDRSTIGNNNKTAGTISDVTVGLALVAPPLLDYFDLGASRALAEDFIVYAEVLSVTGGLIVLSQFTTQRPIPLVYSGDRSPGDPNGYTSFYSGHTAMTFAALSAAATTLTLRYDTGIWPWFAVGALGGSVAYERVAAGHHFPTDVIVGAAAGTLGGVLIPIFHKRGESEIPIRVSASNHDVGLTWTRSF